MEICLRDFPSWVSPTNSSGLISLGSALLIKGRRNVEKKLFYDNKFYPCQFSYKRIG